MAFLDNSGDIILDAVLTDTGRMRLAKGDGSFKIVKFAFSDDEINYELYNKDHPSGSAYYDLEILQTPVLEAFTNNMSSMKSKLISIPRTNLLYLPVLRLQTAHEGTQMYELGDSDAFLVAVDKDTALDQQPNTISGPLVNESGVLDGLNLENAASWIDIHQGLDTEDISPSHTLDSDLKEHQYIIEIDNRLGSIVSKPGSPALVSYIDDDNIASYYLSSATSDIVSNNITTEAIATSAGTTKQVIAGPRGTMVKFIIGASIDLNASTTLFTKLGSTFVIGNLTYYYIDSTIRVTGATTGYRIDIPVRFIKYKSG